jgi:hypothetical protein
MFKIRFVDYKPLLEVKYYIEKYEDDDYAYFTLTDVPELIYDKPFFRDGEELKYKVTQKHLWETMYIPFDINRLITYNGKKGYAVNIDRSYEDDMSQSDPTNVVCVFDAYEISIYQAPFIGDSTTEINSSEYIFYDLNDDKFQTRVL